MSSLSTKRSKTRKHQTSANIQSSFSLDNLYISDIAIENSNSLAELDITPTLSNSQTDKVQPTNPKNNLNRSLISNNNITSTLNQNSDKEMKMETDSSSTITTTSELEENTSNAESAET
ncbi:9711_t:CDS:2, partial [Scutellospora calospora]